MGGQLTLVNSEPDVGTKFSIILPIEEYTEVYSGMQASESTPDISI